MYATICVSGGLVLVKPSPEEVRGESCSQGRSAGGLPREGELADAGARSRLRQQRYHHVYVFMLTIYKNELHRVSSDLPERRPCGTAVSGE
jgi:hypothetical protein